MKTKKKDNTEDKKEQGQEDVNVAEKDAPKKSDKKEDKEPTLEEQLEEVKEELASAKDQNLRLYAEFENYKRRNAKERLELMSSANIEVMNALLPVIDDFERALKNIEKTDQNKALYEGVELIHQKFVDTLKQKGLKPMESSIGEDFDVERMEAVTRLPVPDKKQHGKVIDEIERGYLLGDKVLRYARVVVAHNQG